MIGYKLMESDMTCKGFQYKVDEEYFLEDKLVICKNGFHFCENPFDCLKYYDNIEGDKRLFLVEVLGKVITEDDKSVTNKIKIVEEIHNIEKFFEENINNFVVDWYRISKFQKLSEELIEKLFDKVDWYYISKYQTLSESFIEKYCDKVNWCYISINQTLSEEFIDKYIDKVYWCFISKYQTLSEEFIEKHYDKVDWYNISRYQKLSESFIEKHGDMVSWNGIFQWQKLSEEFRQKHKNKI